MANFDLTSRVQKLNDSVNVGKCVLYVMSRDQRVQDNHALLSAQKQALAENLPLAVVFCLYEKAGFRAREHFEFMIEGLKEVEKDLSELNIPFMLVVGPAKERLQAVFHHLRPTAVYFDFSPLKGPKNLQKQLCKVRPCKVFVVDTHNVVPVWITSGKQEVGARTIRIKIHKKLEYYLVEPEKISKHPVNWPGDVKSIAEMQSIIDEVLSRIKSSGISISFKTGEKAGIEALELFIENKLELYGTNRNDPSSAGQSDLSPYLHFGQLSSLRVALRLREVSLNAGSDLHLFASSKMPKPELIQIPLQYSIDALIEEMIVRKELADNFCYYNVNYDSIESAPGWARKSLEKHRNDPREFLYSLEELEKAQTHDPAWNAAQKQLTNTGKMHGYMRMYWAKKVLEWSPSGAVGAGILDSFLIENLQSSISNLQSLSGAEWAIEVLKYLNDHYSIDGGDPNGYAGIMWSIAGVHDRPWQEREIFGVIRYMNYAGLKRKFDIQKYESSM